MERALMMVYINPKLGLGLGLGMMVYINFLKKLFVLTSNNPFKLTIECDLSEFRKSGYYSNGCSYD